MVVRCVEERDDEVRGREDVIRVYGGHAAQGAMSSHQKFGECRVRAPGSGPDGGVEGFTGDDDGDGVDGAVEADVKTVGDFWFSHEVLQYAVDVRLQDDVGHSGGHDVVGKPVDKAGGRDVRRGGQGLHEKVERPECHEDRAELDGRMRAMRLIEQALDGLGRGDACVDGVDEGRLVHGGGAEELSRERQHVGAGPEWRSSEVGGCECGGGVEDIAKDLLFEDVGDNLEQLEKVLGAGLEEERGRAV